MRGIPKFEGDFLECEGGFYLVKKGVLELYFERMAKLEREIEKMNEKKATKNKTVLGTKSGRKKVLDNHDKITAWELHKKGYSLREIGEVMKVSHETIRQAVLEAENAHKEFQQRQKEKEKMDTMQQAGISTDPLADVPRSNIFGTKSISEDFRKKD